MHKYLGAHEAILYTFFKTEKVKLLYTMNDMHITGIEISKCVAKINVSFLHNKAAGF